MPDGDLYRKAPSFAWKQAFRLIAGGASPQEAARPARIALCHTLRSGKGLPGLGGFGAIVTRVKEGELQPLRAFQEVRAQVRTQGGSQHATLLGQACDRLLGSMLAGEPPPLEPALALAEDACADLLEHHLLQLVELNLVGVDQRFATRSEALAWVEAARDELRDDQVAIAHKLIGDEEAQRLRALYGRSCAEWEQVPLPDVTMAYAA